MLFVVLHIVCILLFFQGLRLVEHRRLPYLPVIAINYTIAAIFALGWLFLEQLPDTMPAMVIGLGGLVGFFYVLHLCIMMVCIKRCGVGLSATVASMSAVSPVLYHFLCYGTPLSLMESCALLLTPLVMFLCREPDSVRSVEKKANLWLIVNFICASAISIMHSEVEGTAASSQSVYTASLFGAAGLTALLVLMCSPSQQSVATNWGTVLLHATWLGLVNIAATAFILLALRSLTPIAVFPVAACCIIIGSAGLSYWFWSECLIRRQYLGMFGAVLVIVLIHC